MLNLARELLAQHPGRLAAIGVSFGGPVDAGRGVVRLSHHVPGWEKTPLRDRLQAELGAPVGRGQRCQRRRAGRMAFRRGPGLRQRVLRHRQHRRRRRVGARRAHLERRGRHGGRDRPQRRAARRRALRLRQGRLRGSRGVRVGHRGEGADALATTDDGRRTTGSGLLALAGGRADAVTAQMVAQAAAEGDALAQELLYGAAEALGMGIGAALNLMNPQRVVLGGGITKSGERWWQIVRETARCHALPQTRAEIVPAAWATTRRCGAPRCWLKSLSMIEIIHSDIVRGRIRHALFDFDGTLSLIREGWQGVMIPMMVEWLLETPEHESEAELTTVVTEFVTRLTGKQTIYQMIQLAEEIEKRGGKPLDPLDYKRIYLDRLWARIRAPRRGAEGRAARARRADGARRTGDAGGAAGARRALLPGFRHRRALRARRGGRARNSRPISPASTARATTTRASPRRS